MRRSYAGLRAGLGARSDEETAARGDDQSERRKGERARRYGAGCRPGNDPTHEQGDENNRENEVRGSRGRADELRAVARRRRELACQINADGRAQNEWDDYPEAIPEAVAVLIHGTMLAAESAPQRQTRKASMSTRLLDELTFFVPVTRTTTVCVPAPSGADAQATDLVALVDRYRSTSCVVPPSTVIAAMPRPGERVETNATFRPVKVNVTVALVVDDCMTLPPSEPVNDALDHVPE